MNSLSERIAIVTGAASGIGRATTRRFVEEGATVLAIDRTEDQLTALAKEHPRIRPAACDVTDHSALERHVQQLLRDVGRIDILVNNAGMSYYERHAKSTLEHWRHTQAVNIEAMYVLAKLVAEPMSQRRYGRIVNVASTQAMQPEAATGAYAASKGAVAAWSRSLAQDLAEFGILVNIVAPGCVHTGMSMVEGVDETTTPMFQEWYVKQRKIPLARAAEPEEIANAILFLSGDQCTYITGHTLVVDGGITITF